MRQAKREPGTPGTYVLNAIYIALSIIGYIFIFWQLAHRWPIG